jgi:hypothetical protein
MTFASRKTREHQGWEMSGQDETINRENVQEYAILIVGRKSLAQHHQSAQPREASCSCDKEK